MGREERPDGLFVMRPGLSLFPIRKMRHNLHVHGDVRFVCSLLIKKEVTQIYIIN